MRKTFNNKMWFVALLLNGNNLVPGTYTWDTNVHITGDITLTGTATDVWIFQIAGTLTQDSARRVFLAGGALPQNVFWQVSGNVNIGTNAHIEGIIVAKDIESLIAPAHR